MNPNFDSEARALSIKYNECNTEFERNSVLSEMFVLCKPLIKYSIYKRKFQPPITYEDLEQECHIGILEVLKARSLETFEGKLTNVLLRVMQSRISMWINRTEHLIRIPEEILYMMYDINNIKQSKGITVTDLLDLGYSQSEIDRYMDALKVYKIDSICENSDDESEQSKNEEMYYNCYTFDEYDYLNINRCITDNVFDDERLNVGFKTLDEGQKDLLFELLNNDMDFELIAQRKNCNTWCIWQRYERIIKKMRKAISEYENPQPKQMSDKDKLLLIQLEECGWNMSKLSRQIGCSDANIRKKVSRIEKTYGITTGVKRNRKPARITASNVS